MKKIKSFFKGIKKEIKMIRWPQGKEMFKYSSVVVCMLAFFALYFYGLDTLFSIIGGVLMK